MKSQESEIPDKKSFISKDESYSFDDPYFFINELFGPFEKKYYHKQKLDLEVEIIALKNKASELKSKKNFKNQYVSREELFQLKYQVIDSFYTKNIQYYADLILSYNQTCIEKSKLQQKIIFYEKEIENQYEIRNSIIQEKEQLECLYDFSEFTVSPYPKLTNIQDHNFTKISFSEIGSEDEDDNNSSDSKLMAYQYKSRINFLTEKIHEQICWSENRLSDLKKEINKFDMLLDTYNESQKRNAANTMSSAQQAMNKKNEISSQTLRIAIDDVQKLFEDSEKVVKELEHQTEELRQKKVKNRLDYENQKVHLKMLRSSSLECYKKELSEMKNKRKYLRRLINKKADEYDFNCESLLIVFNEFDQKINGRKEEIQNVWNETEVKGSNDNQNKEEENEEEEEEIIEVKFNDPGQIVLMKELEKRRDDLQNDVKMMKKQLKRMVFLANSKYDTLLARVNYLQKKEEKYQDFIAIELARMGKLPQRKDACMNQIEASMAELNHLLEKI